MDTKIPAASVSENVEMIPSGAVDFWKAQKRIPERDSDLDDDDDLASAKSIKINRSKRFCGTFPILDDHGTATLAEACFESPVNVTSMLRPKKCFLGIDNVRFRENNAVLSPITEISLNMSETKLNSTPVKEELEGACGGCNDNIDIDYSSVSDVTPLKSWPNADRIGSRNISQFMEVSSQKGKLQKIIL